MASASAVFLIDTNVLLYAYDPRDPPKRARASAVIRALSTRGTGVLTTQILGEFFWTATRKGMTPLSVAEIEAVVADYIRAWLVFDVTPLSVMEAIRGVQRYGFPYWGAVIWATAKLNVVPYILSEDGNDGAVIEGVHFLNPFSATFDLALLSR